MEYNYRQIDLYTRMFRERDYLYIGNTTSGNASLDSNNVFNRLCEIDLTKDNIETPLFAKTIVEDTIRRTPSITKVVMPLYSNSPVYNKNTSDSIIKGFFHRGDLTERLQKVITNKNEVYYGMKGVIFDEHFNPLMFITVSLDKKTEMYNKITIYIHPEVFLSTKGMLHKYIIKKIIPFYLSYNERLAFNLRNSSYNVSDSLIPQIVIEDATRKFIQFPNKPSPQNCIDDKLNQLLIENIEDIIDQMQSN